MEFSATAKESRDGQGKNRNREQMPPSGITQLSTPSFFVFTGVVNNCKCMRHVITHAKTWLGERKKNVTSYVNVGLSLRDSRVSLVEQHCFCTPILFLSLFHSDKIVITRTSIALNWKKFDNAFLSGRDEVWRALAKFVVSTNREGITDLARGRGGEFNGNGVCSRRARQSRFFWRRREFQMRFPLGWNELRLGRRNEEFYRMDRKLRACRVASINCKYARRRGNAAGKSATVV